MKDFICLPRGSGAVRWAHRRFAVIKPSLMVAATALLLGCSHHPLPDFIANAHIVIVEGPSIKGTATSGPRQECALRLRDTVSGATFILLREHVNEDASKSQAEWTHDGVYGIALSPAQKVLGSARVRIRCGSWTPLEMVAGRLTSARSRRGV
jgi:hypothetical protein